MRGALVMIALAACSRTDAPPAPAAAPVSALTQQDLARDVDAAERTGTWREVQQRWLHQRLRWTVIRQRALCLTPDACHIEPFAVQRPAQHGWLPALQFAPGEFAKLSACGSSPQCTLTFEGTLSSLTLSADAPTSLSFSDVVVLAAG